MILDVPPIAETQVELHYKVEDKQNLGRRSEGMLCLPAGNVAFDDLQLPSNDEIAESVSGLLDGQSLERSATLAGEVAEIKIKLCTSWKGIAKTAPKGSIRIRIMWRDTRALKPPGDACIGRAEVDLAKRDPRKSPEPLLEAIRSSLLDARPCLEGTE